MRAYVRVDATNQVVVLTDVEPPAADNGEVVVAVRAFGVGVHDRYFIPPSGPFPYTIGTEGAGVVVSTGVSVSDIELGDRVMISTVLAPQGGTWAELCVVAPASVTAMPDGLDFATATGIPIAGDAAIETMYTLDLLPDETLYVAASGAIGTLVVQMAAQ